MHQPTGAKDTTAGRSLLSVLLTMIMLGALSLAAWLTDSVHRRNRQLPIRHRHPSHHPLTFHSVDQVSAAPCDSGSTGDKTFQDPSEPETCLTLADPKMSVEHLADARTEVAEGEADWTVTITLRDQDRDAMTAPTAASAIPGGVLSITGNFTQREAEDLAHRLGG